MTNFALQFGCLLVMIFFISSYMKESRKTSFPRNMYFNLLLLIAPLDIIFDGVASWTVNNQAVVSRNFILLFHCLFYVCANAVFF